jgi:hypothetical protein
MDQAENSKEWDKNRKESAGSELTFRASDKVLDFMGRLAMHRHPID